MIREKKCKLFTLIFFFVKIIALIVKEKILIFVNIHGQFIHHNCSKSYFFIRPVRNFGNSSANLFQKLKDAITSEPVLIMYDPNRPVKLKTNFSDFAFGAQIGYRDDKGKLYPIAFYSHKLTGPEFRYPIYNKEFLVIINAFKEFRHMLKGNMHQVKVYTNHKNIAHFATIQQLSGKQLKYAEYLAKFNYIIIYRKRSENGRADAISRQPIMEEK